VEVEYCKTEKKFQNPEILRILPLLSDLKYSTVLQTGMQNASTSSGQAL
jgi:hypothetical protein